MRNPDQALTCDKQKKTSKYHQLERSLHGYQETRNIDKNLYGFRHADRHVTDPIYDCGVKFYNKQ